MVFIRPATQEELPRIMDIVETAKQSMRLQGNLTQWSGPYPTADIFLRDILAGNCFVCSDSPDGVAEACFCHLPGPDPNYAHIEQGEWPNDDFYYVLHRIASTGKLKGVGRAAIRFCMERYPALRADTHADNRVMNHLLAQCHFMRCGVIHVSDGTPRIAYEKRMATIKADRK